MASRGHASATGATVISAGHSINRKDYDEPIDDDACEREPNEGAAAAEAYNKKLEEAERSTQRPFKKHMMRMSSEGGPFKAINPPGT